MAEQAKEDYKTDEVVYMDLVDVTAERVSGLAAVELQFEWEVVDPILEGLEE